ncbi:hypothetical protein [Haloplanus sp. C73]|uniref:hypothetical protein n=1 Tax=Haloplanus sp. C73 TaxID=3421641 RepID=UPI003EB977A7
MVDKPFSMLDDEEEDETDGDAADGDTASNETSTTATETSTTQTPIAGTASPGGFGPPTTEREENWQRAKVLSIGGLLLGGLGVLILLGTPINQLFGQAGVVLGIGATAGSLHYFVESHRASRQAHEEAVVTRLNAIHDEVTKSEYHDLIRELRKQRQTAQKLLDQLPDDEIDTLIDELDTQEDTIEAFADHLEQAEQEKLDALRDLKDST